MLFSAAVFFFERSSSIIGVLRVLFLFYFSLQTHYTATSSPPTKHHPFFPPTHIPSFFFLHSSISLFSLALYSSLQPTVTFSVARLFVVNSTSLNIHLH